jgi:hypothetical protein
LVEGIQSITEVADISVWLAISSSVHKDASRKNCVGVVILCEAMITIHCQFLYLPERMITSFFISPHPSLQPFVDNYILSTSNNEHITFNSYWPASNETSPIFYMADQPWRHQIEHQDSLLFEQKIVW